MRADRINPDEPRPETCIPDAPARLPRPARELWDHLAPRLAALNILTELDAAALGMLCIQYARMTDADEKVRRMGTVIVGPSGLRPNPYLTVANAAAAAVHKLLGEFGCTPSSRSKIRAAVAITNLMPGDEDGDDAPPRVMLVLPDNTRGNPAPE